MEVITTKDNYKYCIYKNDYIGECLREYGWFRPTEIFFLKQFINENDNVMEIGANIGSHCIPLSKMNSKGKFFCFEPQIDIYKMLVTNITLNECNNVIPYNYGISKDTNLIYYKNEQVNSKNRGGFSIPKTSNQNAGTFLKTHSIKYFKELYNLESLKLIKIDVEGYECEVIDDLNSLIKKHSPIIFVEYNFDTFYRVCQQMQSLDYNIYYFNTTVNQYDRVIDKENNNIRYADVNLVCFPKHYTDIPNYLQRYENETRPNLNKVVTLEAVKSTEVQNKKNKKIAFLSNKLTLRGTEVAMYDYAHYNEKILGNQSIIISRAYEDCKHEMDTHIRAYGKFEQRFPMFYYKNIQDIEAIIEKEQVDWLYIIKSGTSRDGLITNKCKTLMHCVFELNDKHGTVYAPISEFLNEKFKTNYSVLPHMISLPEHNHNLRKVLNIPENAVVFGGYGGATSFDIPYIHQAIYDTAKSNPNIYFIFATFPQFCPPLPNIIHLPPIVKLEDKVSFINTCNAMVYGRSQGETFGLVCGEFSILNKPIICSTICHDKCHLSILNDTYVAHSSYEELCRIFNSWSEYRNKINEESLINNGYKNYTPEKVMKIFNSLII